jgi:hypothetical protein
MYLYLAVPCKLVVHRRRLVLCVALPMHSRPSKAAASAATPCSAPCLQAGASAPASHAQRYLRERSQTFPNDARWMMDSSLHQTNVARITRVIFLAYVQADLGAHSVLGPRDQNDLSQLAAEGTAGASRVHAPKFPGASSAHARLLGALEMSLLCLAPPNFDAYLFHSRLLAPSP